MARYLFLVMANAVAGCDEVLNKWYDEVHVNEMLSVPSVCSARRYRLAGTPAGGEGRFLTLYEVESDDLAQVQAELLERGAQFHMSDAFDHATAMVVWYEPLGPAVESS